METLVDPASSNETAPNPPVPPAGAAGVAEPSSGATSVSATAPVGLALSNDAERGSKRPLADDAVRRRLQPHAFPSQKKLGCTPNIWRPRLTALVAIERAPRR